MYRVDTTCSMLYTDMSKQYIYQQRYPVGLRPSSGRASAGVPYIGQPPVLYFPRLCPTSAGASGCLRCTEHRPILGRAPADVFSNVVTMGCDEELGESPVKFSVEVKISQSCHRCGFKQHTPRMPGRCSTGVRQSLVKISSLAHRNPHRPSYVTRL